MEAAHLILGSGWHPALFQSEVSTLIPGSSNFITERVLAVDSFEGLEMAATVDQVLSQPGCCAIEELKGAFFEWLSHSGLSSEDSVAVRWSRHGERSPGVRGIDLAGIIGEVFTSQGWRVDLTGPGVTIHLLIDGHNLFWGIPRFEKPPRKGWKDRVATLRPFFKPVSLDPRHARLMLNLCGAGNGLLLDPMCGTGGILVEAGISGIRAMGVDLDPEMVEGSRKNLEWCGASSVDLRCGDATRLQELGISEVVAVCFDPPYGRNAWRSSSSTSLFTSVLQSLHVVCLDEAMMCCMLPSSPDGGLVMELEIHLLVEMFAAQGWELLDHWFIPVHASLGRTLIRARRLGFG